MFQRFQQYWRNIDRENYASLSDPHLSDPLLQELKSSTVSFVKSVLAGRTGYIPRDDNKELMELCLLILGESQTDQSIYRFRQAWAYNMARWMAKVTYNFKIYLFRDQFHLTRHRTEFCLFASYVYVKSWITCPVTCNAPINDLHLLRNIRRYSTVNRLVLLQPWQSFKTTFRVLDPNWCHSVFQQFVNAHEMQHCRPCVCQTYDPEVQWNVRGLKADKSRDLSTTELSDLVNSSSVPALHSLGVDTEFILSSYPHTWSTSAVFQR